MVRCETCGKELKLGENKIHLSFWSKNPLISSDHIFCKIMHLKEWIDKEVVK